MKNHKYRVAIVGGAGMWGRHYLRAYAEHPDCQIVALVDQARYRRQAFAVRYGVKVIFDTVLDMLANDLPDIVSIILPVSQNPEAVIACAEAGVKVVSCEKPIAVTLSQADEILKTILKTVMYIFTNLFFYRIVFNAFYQFEEKSYTRYLRWYVIFIDSGRLQKLILRN